ncbi:type II toxin-antitoxin system HicA family toxin [Capilliphycus salinus ALCB114379]
MYRSAKGSHSRWIHPLLPDQPITISGKDGDDAKPYIEK